MRPFSGAFHFFNSVASGVAGAAAAAANRSSSSPFAPLPLPPLPRFPGVEGNATALSGSNKNSDPAVFDPIGDAIAALQRTFVGDALPLEVLSVSGAREPASSLCAALTAANPDISLCEPDARVSIEQQGGAEDGGSESLRGGDKGGGGGGTNNGGGGGGVGKGSGYRPSPTPNDPMFSQQVSFFFPSLPPCPLHFRIFFPSHSVPLFSPLSFSTEQWNLPAIKAPDAWASTGSMGTRRARVCVVDTG